ncbi:MAG: AraC family transcriptional regulator [Bordetella sp.]|nr:AraC family transcriptional regulator [Bordetella sp.]
MSHEQITASAGAHAPEALEDLLLSGLEVRASLFHVGQYCGRWEASLAGRQRAGFHLVVRGQCWLHAPEAEPVALAPGDAVFFLRDTPHMLAPRASRPDFGAPLARQDMLPLSDAVADGVGLVCGFLDFSAGLSQLLIQSWPDCIVLRAQDARFEGARALLDLLLAELARSPDARSPLIARLIELLLFYTLRHHARYDPHAHGLLALANDAQLGPLLAALVAAPQADWTLDAMAAHVHMSRASFHRRFTLLTALTPAQLLLYVRIQTACQALEQGASGAQAAERAGYQSEAAFARGFQRVMGVSPAAWRRARTGVAAAREQPARG